MWYDYKIKGPCLDFLGFLLLSYLTGVFLLVDYGESILSCLPLGLSYCALHLGALTADHLVSLALSLWHGLLQLWHGLTLHLIHCLFWKECGHRGSQASRTCNIMCIVSPCGWVCCWKWYKLFFKRGFKRCFFFVFCHSSSLFTAWNIKSYSNTFKTTALFKSQKRMNTIVFFPLAYLFFITLWL